eukprot:symbB.v1.2.030138.t1/scaffold3365.1/size58364/4
MLEPYKALRRVLFRDARPLETLRIFTTNGMEVRNLQEFWDQASKAGVVVSAENRPFRGAKTSPVKTFACKPRFSNSLIGSSCCRLDASDPEVWWFFRRVGVCYRPWFICPGGKPLACSCPCGDQQ